MTEPAWKVKTKFKAVQAPPSPPPPLPRHRELGGTYGSNKTWMISFSDIMALMLTFFIMLFAMSEHSTAKKTKSVGFTGRQTQSFDGGVGSMSDSDTISLPRTRQAKGLDVGYLSQVIDVQKKTIPELRQLALVKDYDSVLLTLPLSAISIKNGQVDRLESTQILRDMANILGSIPNEIDIQVEWLARDGFTESVATKLSYARDIRSILEGINSEKNMKISISTKGLDDGQGEPRIIWRILPLKSGTS